MGLNEFDLLAIRKAPPAAIAPKIISSLASTRSSSQPTGMTVTPQEKNSALGNSATLALLQCGNAFSRTGKNMPNVLAPEPAIKNRAANKLATITQPRR